MHRWKYNREREREGKIAFSHDNYEDIPYRLRPRPHPRAFCIRGLTEILFYRAGKQAIGLSASFTTTNSSNIYLSFPRNPSIVAAPNAASVSRSRSMSILTPIDVWQIPRPRCLHSLSALTTGTKGRVEGRKKIRKGVWRLVTVALPRLASPFDDRFFFIHKNISFSWVIIFSYHLPRSFNIFSPNQKFPTALSDVDANMLDSSG